MATKERSESASGSNNGATEPADPALEEKFKQILPSLSLSQAQIDKMSSAQKRTLVTQYQQMQASNITSSITPETIIKQLEGGKKPEKTLTSLRTLLTTELVQWTNRFLELQGHEYIFEIFTSTFEKGKRGDKEMALLAECCRCMKALMNTPEGMARALEWEKSVTLLLQSLEFINIVSQEMVLYLLAALCLLSAEGHVRVLTEMKKGNQFPTIMEFMVSKNEALVTSTLTFVNALLGAASDTQSRVEIRNEFLKMNIKELLHNRTKPSDALLVQIKYFEDRSEEDLDTLIKAGAVSTISTPSGNEDALREKLTKLESQLRSVEFENSTLKEEVAKLKSGAPVVAASPAAAVQVDGGVPPPPGADAGGPPPPPPPGGAGGPPPPPAPGGDGAPPPPPPPGGGPPPPPPPGGACGPPPPPGAPAAPAAPKRPAKAKCTPNKKMRAFGWTKIADAKIDNTIWEKTNDSKVKIDTLEFESLFSAEGPKQQVLLSPDGPASRGPAGSVGASGTPKKATVQLLDPKRSNNCEIMLRGLKMEPAAIKAAIMSMDEKVLTEDTLKTMKEYVPLPEEIQMLKDYAGDKSNLGRAEKYFMAVMDIPKLAARLSAMAYKSGFQEKAEIAKSEIQVLTTAIASVRNSRSLSSLLELVLALGNYMNGSGNNGGCYGFRLNSLNKMMDVKSADGKMTLIHYLYSLVSTKHQELLNVVEELQVTSEAARLNIRETCSKVAELKTGFATLEALLADPGADATFTKTMTSFAGGVKATLEQLDSKSSKLEATFKECVTWYGEPPSTEPEDFFGAISNFLESFTRAKSDNEKRVAAAAKEAQSKALLAAVQSKQVTKKKGQVDDAIAGMKDGTMFARLSVNLSAPPKPKPKAK